ncbi:MAG: cyclic nucleotide-binding domain-containing protein [Alphaproteobacteria bacterium]|nr:cyclic nucleotide-binding domain-containing protein [Alphaproteobacteria bacterium]
MCAALTQPDLTELAGIMTEVSYPAGKIVFDEGEPADALYNITGGAAKLYKLMPDGRRQVTGFLLQGDLLGLAQNGRHSCSAEAIGQMRACRDVHGRFDALVERFPDLRRRLHHDAVDELVEAQNHMLLLGRKTAVERVVSFLLRLSHRQLRHGFTAQPVRLPMTRADIADYLGRTTETVSRTITKLKTQGVIRLRPESEVELVDAIRLSALAGGEA